MNLVTITITDLSEVDFDGLYEKARDAIDASWPSSSNYTDEERKQAMIALITSGLNNEWPGLNSHGPEDTYVLAKQVDLDTNTDVGLVSGFVLPDGTFDGRHSMSAADENGSRNWLYSEQFRQARNDWYASIGVTKTLYRNIPANSIMHKSVRMRQNAGHYTILEDVESELLPGFRNITIEFN
jgi:hypothetical protein